MQTRRQLAACDLVDYRRALSQFATGIAILTTLDDGGMSVGVTINSFTSVSLDPQLVSFSLARTLRSLPAFLCARHIGISVLADHQRDLSVKFATVGVDKWVNADVALSGAGGVPLIDQALANLACEREALIEGGDHMIFICRVVEFSFDGARDPLLFFRGRYWRPERTPLSP